MAAVRRAARPAAQSAADPVNEVNVPVGYPASPIWPGAVDPAQYADPDHITRQSELEAPMPGAQFAAAVPGELAGGGYEDTSWLTGHDGPIAPWDSLAGEPFAPSGAIAMADTHGEDTGAVYQAEHVAPAGIGRWTLRRSQGQTYSEVFAFDPVTGERLSEPNNRVNFDQYVTSDVEGYDPVLIDYDERPIYSNLAHEAVAHGGPGIYSPSGALPDMASFDYDAMTYEAPPEPYTSVAAPALSGGGGGWLLG